MKQPLVSIIIPVYNGGNYMREAIDSAIAQTYKNLEIIVINDGSNDNGETETIALSYGDKIRYFCKPNGGVSSALNFGIQHMHGEYFSWLSHDDVYEQDKVEKQVSTLSGTANNIIICCRNVQIDEKSEEITKRFKENDFQTGIVFEWKEVLKGLLRGKSLNGCCLLIPRDAFIKCGFFDESLRFCQDAFMWYKMFLEGYSLLCSDDYLVQSRVHAKQLTQTGQNVFREECAAISSYLTQRFVQISSKENNFIQLYLLCDAKHLPAKRVHDIILIGRKSKLLPSSICIKAWVLCLYGKIRPYIRKLYYLLFYRIKTT